VLVLAAVGQQAAAPVEGFRAGGLDREVHKHGSCIGKIRAA
jgi:hypothetical protein